MTSPPFCICRKGGPPPRLGPVLFSCYLEYYIGKPESCIDRLRRASGYGASPKPRRGTPSPRTPFVASGGPSGTLGEARPPNREMRSVGGLRPRVWAEVTLSTPYPPSVGKNALPQSGTVDRGQVAYHFPRPGRKAKQKPRRITAGIHQVRNHILSSLHA